MTIRRRRADCAPRAAEYGSVFRIRLGALSRSSSVPLPCVGDDRVGLDFDFDLGPFFQLNPLPVSIGKAVGNANFSIKVISSFHRDLRFFGFARTGMRLNYLFHFSWERCTCLRRLSRHNCGPPPGPTHTCDKESPCARWVERAARPII